jgi:hypothetical protein
MEVIPCCADMELFNPAKIDSSLQQKFRTELNINKGDIIISYLGSIGAGI